MRAQWSSRFNFIMAATGAAVGLGAIWKFPYMAGDNGGGAFVLFYLLCTLFLGIPAMMAEILLGRLGRANPMRALKRLALEAKSHPAWQWVGLWGALGLLLVLSFYSVIAGWAIAYMFKALFGQLSHISPSNVGHEWQAFLSQPLELMLWHGVFMLLTLSVVARGLKGGLEAASRIMMPGLFVILALLMGYSAWIGDVGAAIDFLLKPNFSELTSEVMIDALGQSLFNLAVGAGCMLVYGCYVPEDSKIAHNVSLIALLTVLVSIMSGLAIFPIVFQFGLSPEGGPGLMFQVLPVALANMPAGHWVGGLFFLMLWFAAWTSSISMAEPLVVLCIEQFHLSRGTASSLIGALCWVLGLAALFSFNLLSEVTLLGMGLFDAMAYFATNIILPIGAFCFSLFAGWKISSDKAEQALKMPHAILFKCWQGLIRFVVPIGIILIFIY